MSKRVKRFGQLMVISILALSLFLAGCSKDQASGGNKGGKDGKTEVTFWHGMTDITLNGLEEVIKEFEATHSDIKIKAVYSAGGTDTDEKLLTAIAGGNPPDITYFDRFNIGSWASQGSLEDISEYAANAGITSDNYYPFAWEEASYKGKLYGIPTTTDSRLLFYNKDLFTEVGLDPENPPKTIDELTAAAEKLTIKDGNRFKRIGFIPWYGQGQLYTWGWVFGGEFYDKSTDKVTLNDPKIVEALEWLTDYANKYNIENIASFTDSQGSGDMDPFLTGQLAMQISGPWTVSSIQKYKPDLNYGVTPIPTPTGTDFQTWSGGWSIVMPKGAKNKDAAWEFMKFFGSPEGQKIFSGIVRDFSVIESVNADLGFTEDPILKEFTAILPVSHYRPVIPEGNLLWNEQTAAVEKATRGKGTPQEILDEATDKVNKALEKNQ